MSDGELTATKRRNRPPGTLIAGVAMLAVTAFVIIFGRFLAPYPSTEIVNASALPPSGKYLLGTDALGRDVLSRVLYGGQALVLTAVACTAVAFFIGGIVGISMAYLGGRTERWGRAAIDCLLGVPALLITLVILSGLGAKWQVTLLTVGLVFAPRVALVLRGAASAVISLSYVESARLRGERTLRVVLHEVAPNIAAPMMAELAMRFTFILLFITALDFLGLGAQPPTASWGLMVSENIGIIEANPWSVVAPVAAIAMLCIGVALVADAATSRIAHGAFSQTGQSVVWRRSHAPRLVRGPRRAGVSGGRLMAVPAGPDLLDGGEPGTAQPLAVPAARPKAVTPSIGAHGLSASVTIGGQRISILENLDLDLLPGTITGLAGESGSGKSTAALSMIGFRPTDNWVINGSVVVDGTDLLALDDLTLWRMYGRQLGILRQTGKASFNPIRMIGRQLGDLYRLHLDVSESEARQRAVDALTSVGIRDAGAALRRYPHQFSGGQQQRIALAMALAGSPGVLILDEPTTGLDATTQVSINAMIRRLVREENVATLYISHDLAMLAMICDDIAIMYAGEVVERAGSRKLFESPRHPYTVGLIGAIPSASHTTLASSLPGRPPGRFVPGRCGFADRCAYVADQCRAAHPALILTDAQHEVRCVRTAELQVLKPHRRAGLSRAAIAQAEEALDVHSLQVDYRQGGRHVRAVANVSFSLTQGEALAVVGESGSGKSSLLRAIAGLHTASGGTIRLREYGELDRRLSRRDRDACRAIQLIFQNPHDSLNPSRTVGRTLGRSIALAQPGLSKAAMRGAISDALAEVGLTPDLAARRPAQLSGGQQQRVAIAAALALRPKILLCDEIVSALDVSVAASILELLAGIRQSGRTSLVFVTHNIAQVRAFADRVAIMKDGVWVESGGCDEIFTHPREDYTRQLLGAVPDLSDLENWPDDDDAGRAMKLKGRNRRAQGGNRP